MKIFRVLLYEWLRYFLKVEFTAPLRWKIQWLICNSEMEPPASLPLAGSQFCGAAASVLRGLSDWPQNLSSVSLGTAHSFFMFLPCWHKFFLSHSWTFNYLKYHYKIAFKVLSLIPTILLQFLALCFSPTSILILLNSSDLCCWKLFPDLWFSDFKCLQTLGIFSVWRWTLAKLISSGDMKAWLVILACSTSR